MKQREIKFRAWDKMTKTIRLVDNISFAYSCCYLFFLVNEKSRVPESRLPEQVEIMQFTGLLDKNGKEIWEGDVVETETSTGLHKFEVEYDNEKASYMCPHIVDDECETTLGQLPNSIEIIGNIYENPELITPNDA